MVIIRYLGKCVLCGAEVEKEASLCDECSSFAMPNGYYAEERCSECSGRGKVYPPAYSNHTDRAAFIEHTCLHCGGTGKRRVLYRIS